MDFFGLPLHPLVVHAVVVLLPLSAMAAVAMSVFPQFSVRFGVILWPLSWLSTAASALAVRSGEQLAPLVGGAGTHGQIGQWTTWIALVLSIAMTLLWWFDRRSKGKRQGPVWMLAGVTIVIAAVTCYWVIRVGHSGAELVWLDRLPA